MPIFIFDDYYGDERRKNQSNVPTYLPAVNQWDPIGGTCPGCTLSTNLAPQFVIDPTQVQNGTWHSTTVSPDEPETTISITFNGTAISAYCLLPPDFGPDITSYMNMTFRLDGRLVGSFERVAETDQWTYNHSVYSTSGLENKEHTFVLQPRADVNTSFLVFDYFAYDFNGPPPSSVASSTASSSHAESAKETRSSTPTPTSLSASVQGSTAVPTGAIAGGVIGGVLILVLVVFSLWYMAYRRPRKNVDKIYSRRNLSLDLEGQELPPPVPFMTGIPESASVSSPWSGDALLSRSADPGDRSEASSVTVAEALSSLPDSAEEKRALHEAGLRRIREVEQRIAGNGELDEEGQELRREVEILRAQVQELSAALQMQTEGVRTSLVYDEPPPRYKSGLGAA